MQPMQHIISEEERGMNAESLFKQIPQEPVSMYREPEDKLVDDTDWVSQCTGQR